LRIVVTLVGAIVLGLPTGLAAQDATPLASPVAQSPPHGALLPQMDLAVAPGDDFYRYATGAWKERTVIPADEAAYSVGLEVHELTI
jgi:hypothetical protein